MNLKDASKYRIIEKYKKGETTFFIKYLINGSLLEIETEGLVILLCFQVYSFFCFGQTRDLT